MARLLAFPAVQPAEPVTTGNVDNLVLGRAVSADSSRWALDQFAWFLTWFAESRGCPDGDLVPLRINHEAHRFGPHGAEPANAGACLGFASVTGNGYDGVFVLAELYAGWADQILRDMANGQWLGMSVGAAIAEYGGCSDVWILEVSLTALGDQADPGAKVISTGKDAARDWTLLTGRDVPAAQ